MSSKISNKNEADEWWIDWLEGEIDGETEKDLLTLIARSPKHRARWKQWQRLRSEIRQTGSEPSRQLGQKYWSEFTQKVMRKIETRQSQGGTKRTPNRPVST